MKKSLLALAVLGAFAGAASAQSSVTIYGKIDLGIAKANEAAAGNSTLAGAPSTDKIAMQQGAASRLGFRGTEDLGGGLKGIFNLEHRFTADDGVGGGNAAVAGVNVNQPFWMQSWLGLSGGFGEVRLGRDYTPLFYVSVAADPFGYDTVGQSGSAHGAVGLTPTNRFNNAISYKTPNFGGLTALVAFAPKEAATGKNAFGANVTYTAGPLALGAAFENAGNQVVHAAYTGTPATTQTFATGAESSLYILSAAYNLGFVRPMIAYSQGEIENAAGVKLADRSNIQIGATAPLGGGELKALFARRSDDAVPGSAVESDITKFGIGYHYPLSKRTKVYADLGTAKQDRTGAADLERRTAFDIGVQHNF